jgi:capsular polysaccharide transport system permease protein
MVTILDMLIARTLLEAAGVTSTVFLLLGVATLFDMASLPERPLWLFLAIFFQVWFAFACSMICCAATHDNRLVARLVHPLTYLMMPISGAFYVLSWVPEPYKSILWYVPFVQIFEMARYGQFYSSPSTYFDVLYLLAVCSVLTFFGLLAVSVVRRHIHLS